MVDPKRKALMKPFELIGISAVFGGFVGFIVVYTMGLANLLMGIIAGVGTFIVAIVVLAMLVLSYRPNASATHYLDRFETESSEAETAVDAAADAATDDDVEPTTDAHDESATDTHDESAPTVAARAGTDPADGADGAAVADEPAWDTVADPAAAPDEDGHAAALDDVEIIDVIEVDDTASDANDPARDEHADPSGADADRR